jgi:hypothetical protein
VQQATLRASVQMVRTFPIVDLNRSLPLERHLRLISDLPSRHGVPILDAD